MRLDRIAPTAEGSASVRVVIEPSRGCRNKYSYEPKERVFVLKKVLPEGHVFPFDFGFIPRTKGEDGDPLDVLVLMDEPAFPGCVWSAGWLRWCGRRRQKRRSAKRCAMIASSRWRSPRSRIVRLKTWTVFRRTCSSRSSTSSFPTTTRPAKNSKCRKCSGRKRRGSWRA